MEECRRKEITVQHMTENVNTMREVWQMGNKQNMTAKQNTTQQQYNGGNEMRHYCKFSEIETAGKGLNDCEQRR